MSETTTTGLWRGDEVYHNDRQWTVDGISLIDDVEDVYDVKLHRVPGWHDDALSEEWLDETVDGGKEWAVLS